MRTIPEFKEDLACPTLALDRERGEVSLSTTPTKFCLSTVILLVVLRLAIGWHFYMSGVEKYTDPGFSSAGFLSQAKGPLAPFYLGLADSGHDWRGLLATPREDRPDAVTPPESAASGDVPSSAPYKDWAERILADWQAISRNTISKFGLNEAQQKQAADAYTRRANQLKYYLWEEWPAIAEYRHDLLLIERTQAQPTTGELPYHDDRITTKQAEMAAKARAWVASAADFERGFLGDLNEILTDEQRARGDVFSMGGSSLGTIDTVVTYLTLGVGACLLLGLFTRCASLVGGVFLLSVIGAQFPGSAGAEPVYYQVIEAAAIFTLATLPVGRWAGLDFFIHALWSGCCGGAKAK